MSIIAWHFTNGWRLRDRTPLEIGRTYTIDGNIKLCERGFHASRHPMDALKYAPGSVLSLVRCDGAVIDSDDKLVCSERTVLDAKEFAPQLRLYACERVRTVRHLITDERSIKAVEVAERFARGWATKEELAAAWGAAWDAAWDAARDAAGDAARDAAGGAARVSLCSLCEREFADALEKCCG